MTWFKENKFLTGLLIFTLIGAGVLGYLLMTSKAKYEESTNAFDQQAAELHRLETLPAYPDKDNLEVLESQRVAHLGLIEDLQKSLAAAQFPSESITPNGFQDQLRVAVTGVTGKASAAIPPVDLPKGFYLGFNPYQSLPPTPEAAAPLSRELKVVQMIAQVLFDHKIAEIKRFDRESLPEEIKARPVAATPKPKTGSKPEPEPLLKAHALDITFVVEQQDLEGILNAFAKNKEQFLIARYVSVHNTNDKAPQRSDLASAPPPPPTTPTADPSQTATQPTVPTTTLALAPGEKPKSPMIVGEEKVEVTIHLEIVDFNKPVAPAAGAKTKLEN